ncbi:hypothetical protein [Microlunatus ginsengisoli]|uniref:Uncharacterized protein n=1 Tax=Microlunatus ginsengisoli TaxID=363863 RepID=A0ABP7ADI3_9ACTN
MIQIDPELQFRRERDAKVRVVVTVVAGLCMIASALLPHITVVSAEYYGRSLLRVQYFFLKADATAAGWGSASDPILVASGINAAYYGLAAQEAGLVLSAFSIWALLTEGVGRWVRRLAVVAGWLLVISAPLVITGWRLLNAGGVPTKLGAASLFALAAGLIMVIGARAAKRRLDSTWYWSKPDLIT